MRRILLFSAVLILVSSWSLRGQDSLSSLEECVRRGVERSLRIQAQRLERDEKKSDIEVARKIFVPKFASDFSSSKFSRKLDYTSGITKQLPDGSSAEFAFRGKSYFGDDANHDHAYVFSLNRPLLRSFGRSITGIDIDLSKLDYSIGFETFKVELNSYISDIIGVYFELFFARKNLEVQEQALKRAKEQYDEIKKNIEAGAIPGQELFLVDENVVGFEIKRDNALRDIAWNELQLRKLLSLDPVGSETIVPADSFEKNLDEAFHFDASWETLQTQNPAFQIKKMYFQRARISHEQYRNAFLPLLDLHAEYEFDRGRPSFEKNQYRVGVAYEVPFERTAEKSRIEKSKMEIRRTETGFDEVRMNMRYDLQKVFLDLEHLRKIHISRGKVHDLSQKKLDAEVDKFQNGISTLADVVRFQRELEDAAIEEVRALIAWNRMRMQAFLLEGTLYQRFGITIE